MARRGAIALISIVTLMAANASAQVDFGSNYGISLGSDMMNGAMMSSTYAPASSGGRRSVRPVVGAAAEEAMRARRRGGFMSRSTAVAVSLVPTTYRRDPEVSRKVADGYVQFIARRSSEDAEIVRSNLRHLDPVSTWAEMSAENGLHPGDVADAFAGYYVLNWLIANGADADRPQTLAVREQMRPIIAKHPRFTALSEAQRQEMAEALMINFIFQRDTYKKVLRGGDRALLARLRDAAAQRFQREIGVDPRRLLLTTRGFVQKS